MAKDEKESPVSFSKRAARRIVKAVRMIEAKSSSDPGIGKRRQIIPHTYMFTAALSVDEGDPVTPPFAEEDLIMSPSIHDEAAYGHSAGGANLNLLCALRYKIHVDMQWGFISSGAQKDYSASFITRLVGDGSGLKVDTKSMNRTDYDLDSTAFPKWGYGGTSFQYTIDLVGTDPDDLPYVVQVSFESLRHSWTASRMDGYTALGRIECETVP